MKQTAAILVVCALGACTTGPPPATDSAGLPGAGTCEWYNESGWQAPARCKPDALYRQAAAACELEAWRQGQAIANAPRRGGRLYRYVLGPALDKPVADAAEAHVFRLCMRASGF